MTAASIEADIIYVYTRNKSHKSRLVIPGKANPKRGAIGTSLINRHAPTNSCIIVDFCAPPTPPHTYTHTLRRIRGSGRQGPVGCSLVSAQADRVYRHSAAAAGAGALSNCRCTSVW